MYHVLLAVDTDGDQARRQAETVAGLPEAPDAVKATVYHSFTDNPSGASATQIEGVRRARDVLEERGVEVAVGEGSGDPAESVVEEASRVDADAICVGGRKRSPTGKALFGSVSQQVILNSPVPVVLPGRAEG
ncbi:universal stress protein [Halostella sp. JP-L12]|uniref:universal stress protein n=1 Tax=Halostella TaxID=1843185 RepID=UPI000EF82C4E|nr:MULTISPECIES: universal stress protein [Halostella]NHN47948.1 universal stress protein [Halostella sp. JP-L12]